MSNQETTLKCEGMQYRQRNEENQGGTLQFLMAKKRKRRGRRNGRKNQHSRQGESILLENTLRS